MPDKTKPKEKEDSATTVAKLKEFYDIGVNYYGTEQRKLKLLDETDKGGIWTALGATFPPYQILPDTNYVTYVKSNLLASLYTVTKSAEVIPTSDDDTQITMDINIALGKVWDLCDVGYYQFLAGERAALLNLGVTQVGWDDAVTGGTTDTFYKGNIALKNIDPIKYMRDPFAQDLDTSEWAVTYETYHKSVLLRNKNYKEGFGKFLKSQDQVTGIMDSPPSYTTERSKGAAKDNYTLYTYWVHEDDNSISEYHVVNNSSIIYEKHNIVPNCIPLAEMYCNPPTSLLIGCSEPAKIFANNVAMNLMDSIALTAEYKNQRPPKFISSQSGLSINAFTKHGDEADKTFIVNGDARQAVHYHEFPQISPYIGTLKQSLQWGMESVTGVDGKYTGRDTGSIITTGGTEEMLNRVTLIDAPKILMYEHYAKRLTKLILGNLLEFCPKRKYFYREPAVPGMMTQRKWKTLEVDWTQIDTDTLFEYSLSISSELPKNKQRIAMMANMLMEKQMQYAQQGNTVNLITEEEWLQMQDLPEKERMLERMGLERATTAIQETSQVLMEYAELVKSGMDPTQALLATAQHLQEARQTGVQPPSPTDMMMQQAGTGPGGTPQPGGSMMSGGMPTGTGGGM